MSETILMEKFKKAVDKFSEDMYQSTHIFICHPNTLLTINLNDFNSNIWFISHQYVDEGCVIEIKDDDMKRDLYKFCEEHQDRIFKGSK